MSFFLILIIIGLQNEFCDGCNVGFYGDNCSNKCPKYCHDNECNVTTGNCLSCMKGHYRNNTKDCVPCPEQCTACSSNNFCFACKSGFRGEVCDDYCTNCKPDTSCDKNTGYCFENCSEGQSGELCNIPCDSKCKSCDRHNKSVCISCAKDENGKLCNAECLNQCLRSTCNGSQESCAYECSSGYRADKTCNQTCLSDCKDRVCNITCKEWLTTISPNSSKADIGLILGLAFGSLALVIICCCVIVTILVRRRDTKTYYCCISLGGRKRVKRTTTTTVNEKEEQLLLEERRTNDSNKVKSVENMSILETQGTSSAGNNVTDERDRGDIVHTFSENRSKGKAIKQESYTHNKSSLWLQFFNKEQTKEYVQEKLNKKQLFGDWEINDIEVSVRVSEKGKREQIKITLLESVIEVSVPVDNSQSLLNSDWWADLMKDIKNQFRNKVDICTYEQKNVVIIGTDDSVQRVKQLVKDFFDTTIKQVHCEQVVCDFIADFWTNDDLKEIENHGVFIKAIAKGFELRGIPDNLIKGRDELELKLKNICSRTHILQGTGIFTVLEAAKHSGTISAIEKECKCVIKLQQEIDESLSAMLNDYESIDTEILEENQQYSSSNQTSKCFRTRTHKIKIQLVQGKIDQQKADIIVVGEGSVLWEQGGPQLQIDFNRLYPNGIQDGEVAVVDPGNFNCDKVYLTSLTSLKESRCNGVRVLRNFLRECLRLADKYDKNTISFSSSVTSRYLGYPMDKAASIMYGAVVEFDSSYSKTSLKEINIVIDNEEDEVIMAYKDQEQMRIYGALSTASLSTDFVGGRITIELVTGDLSAQQVDSILCSVSSDMNLTRSESCKYLVQNGGDSLQVECEEKYNNKLDVGKVVDISGGDLLCKTVFLTVLPAYTEKNVMEQSLITILQRAFEQTCSKGYKALAVPALGTDYLNYPKTTVAKCMYDAVIDWANKNPDASLKVFRMVILKNDTEAQQAFRFWHFKTQGSETRAKRNFLEGGTILIKPGEDSRYRMVKDGCAIGPIQLQVQVGDLLNNRADAVVVVSANFDTTAHHVREKDGVVITDSSGLKASYVIHVQFQDSLANWRSKLVDCLKEASKKSIQSIAFPVFGSGAGLETFPADSIGECLFAAIDDFTSQNPESSVTDVRLVVDDSNAGCMQAIMAALQAKTTAVSLQSGIGKIFKTQIGSVADSKMLKESSVTIHSDATVNIDRCIKALDDRIGLDFTKKVVVDVDIRSFNDEQIISMTDSDIIADVVFNKQARAWTIVGPLRNVHAAVTCLHNKIQQYKGEENSRCYEHVLHEQTRWHWLCEDPAGSEKEVPYDIMPGSVIETAYKDGKQTVELQSKDGKIYVIDFHKLVEYAKINTYDRVMVIRRDIFKVRTSKSTSEKVEGGALNSDNKYKKVKSRFLAEFRTGCDESKTIQSVEVIKIQRIQNETLNQQYKTRKKQIETQNSGRKAKERKLWHITSEESVHRIVNFGFNRSYCEVHDDSCGQGVYFAKDAYYAAHSYIAENNSDAVRHMFLAKVLTGQKIKGNSSMRVLPLVDQAKPAITYDSAVDDVNNPMQFVIFHDKQAYPKYLITYTSK